MATNRSSSRRTTGDDYPLAGITALVIEEDTSVADLLRQNLTQLGANLVELARNKDEALDTLGIASRPTALVVVNVAADNGFATELLELLRRHNAPIRVIVFADVQVTDITTFLELIGVAAVISQPFTLGTFRTTVREVMAAPVTVRDIITNRTVPATIDPMLGMAVYGDNPGQRFGSRIP
jgi:DNA-binding NtrC family response regulator